MRILIPVEDPPEGGVASRVSHKLDNEDAIELGRHSKLLPWLGDRHCSRKQITLRQISATEVQMRVYGLHPSVILKEGQEASTRVHKGETATLSSGDKFFLYTAKHRGHVLLQLAEDDELSPLLKERPSKGSKRKRSSPDGSLRTRRTEIADSIFEGVTAIFWEKGFSPTQKKELESRFVEKRGRILSGDSISGKAPPKKSSKLLFDRQRGRKNWQSPSGVKDEDHIPTHLIVSGSTASETLKDAFSQRLLSSVTIVTADWVIESLQAKQKLSEELYKGSGTVSIHSEDVREGSVQPVSAPPSLLIAKSDGTDAGPASGEGASSSAERERFPAWCCLRHTPLRHKNEHIVGPFEELASFYGATGDKERELSFRRAAAVLKAWPVKVADVGELKNVAHIGPAMRRSVKQILETGTMERLESFRHDREATSLLELCKVHAIGPSKAKAMYDRGVRSVDDLHKALCRQGMSFLAGETHPSHKQEKEDLAAVPGHVPAPILTLVSGLSREQKLAIYYFRDLNTPLTRPEAEDIAEFVEREMRKTVITTDGFLFQVCGGYRRGKEAMHDLDVLISHKQRRIYDSLLSSVTARLEEVGLLIHSLRNHPQKFPGEGQRHFESSDVLLGIILWKGVYRRLDIVCVPPQQWTFQVLGWTGSQMFERDIRRFAKDERGINLSQHGMTSVEDGSIIGGDYDSEEKIFARLGIPYIPPHLRCC